jgi:hypothetical protein
MNSRNVNTVSISLAQSSFDVQYGHRRKAQACGMSLQWMKLSPVHANGIVRFFWVTLDRIVHTGLLIIRSMERSSAGKLNTMLMQQNRRVGDRNGSTHAIKGL